MKKFPNTMYGKIADDSGLQYVEMYEDLADAVNVGDTIKIGVYELADVCDAVGSVQLTSARRKK